MVDEIVVASFESGKVNGVSFHTGKMMSGSRSPSAYIELLKTFPPRPISSEEELLATQKVIDSLIDRSKLTPDEQDYLNVLGTLVYEYEQLHHESIPDIHGVELIEALLAENDQRHFAW